MLAPLEDVLRSSMSAWVGVIGARKAAGATPYMPRIFERGGDWFAVVTWPEHKFHWLLLPLIGKPDFVYDDLGPSA